MPLERRSLRHPRLPDGFLYHGQLYSHRQLAIRWHAKATKSHRDVEAVEIESIDLSNFLGLLNPGENILAIQGMNNSRGGSDFLMEPTLTSEFETAP